MITVRTRLRGDHDHDVGKTVFDGSDGLHDHAQPETASMPRRSEPQVVDQFSTELAGADAVNVVQTQCGIGKRAQNCFDTQAA